MSSNNYQAATEVSTQTAKGDTHSVMIGYVLDEHSLYTQLDAVSAEPTDLDDYKGHSNESKSK